MAMSFETKKLKSMGLRRALARTRKKLDEAVKQLPEDGVITFSGAEQLNEVARLTMQLRNLSITLAYLCGIPSKVQSVAYQLSEGRISQIVKSMLKR
jgi:hypothetical protein